MWGANVFVGGGATDGGFVDAYGIGDGAHGEGS